ncbi:MAG: hypothetical protein A2Y12_10810 [Planctomycetes bacterium GWF2_42_9]|nr:MAG: hypothetical protein A2Y12_10810 [Planctomycetes bacterium GWF2_42_9]HAL45742.1 hypothetical protein [Phycisphaerales bacterium]
MANIFVSSTGPKGTGNGINEANAMDLANALSLVTAGDYVWIKNDGVYYGNFVVGCSGSYNDNTHIYFIGYNNIENCDFVNHISDMDFGQPFWGGPSKPNSANCWVNINGNGAADNVVYQYQKHNIHWRNIHFNNTSKTSGASAYYVKYTYGTTFTKCKFTDSYINLWIDLNSASCVINCCYFGNYTSVNMDITTGSNLIFIINSVFQGGQLRMFKSMCFNNIFIGGNYAVGAHAYQNIVFNNTMYDQTSYCLGYGHASYVCHLMEYNNVFVPASKSVPTIYKSSNGTMTFSGYGNAYCVRDNSILDTPYVGLHGLNVNPQFVNADGNDFRILNPAILRGGMPDYTGQRGQIGAGAQEYQFSKRSATANRARLSVIK